MLHRFIGLPVECPAGIVFEFYSVAILYPPQNRLANYLEKIGFLCFDLHALDWRKNNKREHDHEHQQEQEHELEHGRRNGFGHGHEHGHGNGHGHGHRN